jgi:hypothetical protein
VSSGDKTSTLAGRMVEFSSGLQEAPKSYSASGNVCDLGVASKMLVRATMH